MRAIALVALVTLGLAGSRAAADPTRVQTIATALAAVRELGREGRDRLDRAVYERARTHCTAGSVPRSACLAGVAHDVCGGDATCLPAADVLATNLRGVDDLIDETTRFRLLRSSSEYRVALGNELHRRYAVLATELALASPPGVDLATAIDRLCATRDRVAHACAAGDPACMPSLPWSRCVTALVWFVGGASP